MADAALGSDFNHPVLNLSADEKRYFKQLFNEADTESLGVVTGEVAVKFFERTRVPSPVLGIIWQIADTENRGLLTSGGFCIVLRLIGHYQAGREPTNDLAFKPAPLPKFDGLNPPPAVAPPPGPPPGIQPQISGPIRVPPLSAEKSTEYALLFDKFGTNGILAGDLAKQIFEKAGLSNEMLSRIWNLADTEQRGALSVTEFIIAMHLLASVKSGAMRGIPNNLPAGLYEAASRRVQAPPRITPGPLGPSAIPRQFSGQNNQRTQSPLGRPPFGTPPQSTQTTGNDWLVTPQDKSLWDSQFSKVDKEGHGYITGEQAVAFFTDSGLPEDILAAIWDLADINSVGQLTRDEFAVAMYLIRQQRKPGVSLPTALPPNLIPPSMRNQVRPVARTTAPAFETQYTAPQPPKSAADDLFGLDSFSAPAPQQTQQSTGGSGSFSKPFDSDPFGSKTSSPTSPQFQTRNQRPDFKPFMPTSSFGQSLTSRPPGPQASSPLSQSRELPQSSNAMDDLLGDNDPEVSKKLTQETTELANMSNQIGTLRTQMSEVQNKKGTTEKELAGASTQKRDLELRLSQFRTQYEQEVRNVKIMEEKLTTSRNETRKLQQELGLIQGSYNDLQNDYNQKAAAFEADQQENASLKERIRQINNEINSLRPQLDKLRSDARQQKGMVSINKKQLSTNEQERDKLRNEMNEFSKAPEPSRSPYPTASDSNVASPAASTISQSTNPFFRKSPAPAENTMSPSGFSRSDSLANTKDFDNIFGPSSSAPQNPPPQTSFKSENHPGSSVRSSEPDVPTPSTSPPLSSYHESPRTVEAPPPPESRQFNSNFLPLREAVPRSDSFSSSVKVSAPASRYDDAAGAETPTASNTSSAARARPETSRAESSSYGASLFNRNQTASPAVSAASESTKEKKDSYQSFGPPSVSRDIPGAFPGDANSPIQPDFTGGSSQSKGGVNRNDPFASKEPARAAGSSQVDFDSAFADFGKGRQVQERQNTGSSNNGSTAGSQSQSKFNKEFPPIEEFGRDEDSDSNSERGFADNFTPASPQRIQEAASRPTTGTTTNEGTSDDFFKDRPAISSEDSDLPTPNAQNSPPTYDQTVGTQRSGSNQFPQEYSGLLPSRADPTLPPQGSQSPEKSFSSPIGGNLSQGHNLFGGGSTSSKPSAPNTTFSASPPPNDTPTSTVPSDAYHSAVSHPSSHPSGSEHGPLPTIPKTTFSDDFDSGFDDLSEAKEADEKADDDFVLGSQHRDGLDEFNPVFDSPAASKSNTMASQQTPTGKPTFGDDSDFDSMSQSFSQGKSQPPATSSHDWDAIFSGKDSSNDQVGTGESSKSGFPSFDGPSSSEPPKQPQLSRALSASSEHDDPIVKQFTSMGFSRSQVVPALEKYDYDVDKAGEYLASETK